MPELCAKCGEPLHGDDYRRARLCPRHLREKIAVTPPFVDGSRVTPGSEGCRCDTDGRVCEFPCWQRLGLTPDPCCPDCAPLDEPEPEPRADAIDLAGRRANA